MAFVLGPALSMQAMHGGKAKNDKMDAQKIAVLLRGGLLPQAYVYPAERRAPRDLWRRRMPLMRQRAALLAHVQHTNSPYTLPALGKKTPIRPSALGSPSGFLSPPCRRASKSTWPCFYDDRLLSDLALYSVQTARHHDAHTLSRLQTVPGIGKM